MSDGEEGEDVGEEEEEVQKMEEEMDGWRKRIKRATRD